MKGEQLELELLADEVRKRAGLAENENALATTIAVRLLGPTGVAIDPDLHGVAYLRRRSDGGFQIVVRPGLVDVRFVIAHELGHYALREVAHAELAGAEEERAANYLAAAILAPAESIRRAHRYFGNELRQLRPLAKTFGLSQTSTQLRLGEVLGDERAIVTARNGNILTRGQVWATVPVLEVARGSRRTIGILKVTLRGGIDEGRIALRAR